MGRLNVILGTNFGIIPLNIGGGFPVCAIDYRVAWYRDLNTITNNEVVDSVGTRTDTVYYGQYLTAASGQINLYRSIGTYDYVDPSTGNTVTGNIIPANGLITIPANGICEITTDDGSRYPICERAGDILHDVLENSKHISVDTAVWDETLYGSDFLNQCGFIDKATSDGLGLPWTATVNGVSEVLDDNCLVPIALWEYDVLEDNTGEIIQDNTGEPIEVRVNI